MPIDPSIIGQLKVPDIAQAEKDRAALEDTQSQTALRMAQARKNLADAQKAAGASQQEQQLMQDVLKETGGDIAQIPGALAKRGYFKEAMDVLKGWDEHVHATQGDAGAAFTLSEGQSRYNSAGQLIAGGGSKAKPIYVPGIGLVMPPDESATVPPTQAAPPPTTAPAQMPAPATLQPAAPASALPSGYRVVVPEPPRTQTEALPPSAKEFEYRNSLTPEQRAAFDKYQNEDANRHRPVTSINMGGPANAGGLTPEGVEYAATQYRVTGAMPPLGMASTGARTAVVNAAAQQARLLAQSPAVSIQKQAAYKADGASLTRMRTMSASAESFETKAIAQADIVGGLSAKVSRTQFPIINSALLAGKRDIVGDQDTQLLYNAISTFTSEYAKIMEGSTGSAAAASDSARRQAATLVSAGLNKGTLQATLDLMKREMALTISGYDATIDHITTRMGGTAPASAAPVATGESKFKILSVK